MGNPAPASAGTVRPLLTVPLYGAECVHCGQPARGLAILSDRRVVVHQARIPHCSTPITNGPHVRRYPAVIRGPGIRPGARPRRRWAAAREETPKATA
jgi:hypothetical protein